ncbi:hypothetical protein GCM10025867_47800 (plasmid) [Frondihabitans sucicola]|uniref:Uncharacterized protein n=1 Tax=Frondihabitans sucicola TaxID=1268041 RepID=A0ABM8GVP4_9MICO|nr:hypothetical protein [Frondihabitans sucicola]BDZ52539.1 hypothetical protein GCM10025867_47800 [Frondihabitans sucicola]
MCLSENDKYGPRRCSGHAREEYANATVKMDAIRVEAATLRSEADGYREAWVASTDAALRHGDKGVDQSLTPEERLKHLDAAEQDRAAAASAKAEYLRIGRESRVAQVAFGEAADVVNTKRAQYDATPEGITSIAAQLNQAEVDYRHAETQDQKIDAGTRVTMLRDRRYFAERSAKREAIRRITNFEDLDATHERANSKARWEMALDDAQAHVDAARTPDEKLAANAGLLNAQAHMRDIHREERGISRMNPWQASGLGDASDEEIGAWGNVSSAHKPIGSFDGYGMHEIMVRREANGVVTQAKFEVPTGTYGFDSDEPGRHPDTTIIMRDITTRARAYDRAGGSRKAFVEQGGTPEEFSRAKTASTTFARLFSSSAPRTPRQSDPMCKSADEPGGPYRCSSDMDANYRRSVRKLAKAAELSAWVRAQRDMSRARADAFADAIGPQPDQAQAGKLAAFERTAVESQKLAGRFFAQEQAAVDDMQHARDERDATPRGLGDLALERAEARSQGDPAFEAAIQRRIHAAEQRMDSEARERMARNPTSRARPFVQRALAQTTSTRLAVSEMVEADRVSATEKLFEWGGGAHQVRVFRQAPGEDRPREVQFTASPESRSADQLVDDLARDAGRYRGSGGYLDRFVEAHGFSSGGRTGARGEFAAARKAHERLVALFGDERAGAYCEAAGSASAPARRASSSAMPPGDLALR